MYKLLVLAVVSLVATTGCSVFKGGSDKSPEGTAQPAAEMEAADTEMDEPAAEAPGAAADTEEAGSAAAAAESPEAQSSGTSFVLGTEEESKDELGHPAMVKDMALEDQKMLREKYIGRHAWTRATVEDLTEREVPGEPKKKVVPRDRKVEVIDLTFSYNGAVTVLDKSTYGGNIPKRQKIVHGLGIERPITVAKFEKKLHETFWFKDPVLRQVGYIRKWGKDMARAVVNHEVKIGMPAEAALESWGIPTTVRTNDIGGKLNEQWAYKEPQRTKYIYIIDGKVSKWEE